MTPQDFIAEVKDLQDGLRRFLLALCCGNGMKADDIAQEALIKAYLSYESLRERKAMKSWLFSIAYRTFIDGERPAAVAAPLETVRGAAADAAMESDANFRYQHLHAVLARINPRERSAILLYYFEGLSTAEIAAMTDATEAAVRQQISRGRQHLRTLLSLDL